MIWVSQLNSPYVFICLVWQNKLHLMKYNGHTTFDLLVAPAECLLVPNTWGITYMVTIVISTSLD